MSTRERRKLRLNREEAHVSRTVEARWEKRNYDLHRARLRTAQPAVTSGWGPGRAGPPQYSHMHHNAKKAMLMEERFATIEYENSLLLGKMRRIMQLGTVATNPGVFVGEEVVPRSLNEGQRRRELERITNDNLGIVRRIQDCVPSYGKDAWERAHRQKQQHLDRISRYPPASSPSGSSYGWGSAYSSSASPDRYDPFGTDYLSGADVMERLRTAPSTAGGGRRRLRPLSRDGAGPPSPLPASSFPPYGSASTLGGSSSPGSSGASPAPPPPRRDAPPPATAPGGRPRVALECVKAEGDDWSQGPWVRAAIGS